MRSIGVDHGDSSFNRASQPARCGPTFLSACNGFGRLSGTVFGLHLLNRVAIEATIMKAFKVLGTAIVFLLPGAIIPAYAQGQGEKEKAPEQKQQQAKPAPQQAKPAQQQAKPAPQQAKQQEAKPAPQQAKQQEAKPAPQRAKQQEAKPAPQQAKQQEAKPAPQQAKQQEARPAPQQAKVAPQSERAQQPQQARSAQPARAHGRIPDDRYRASFGSGHTFHVNRAEFAGGPGRFQYGGYSFITVDPWPVAWLYTDNVYVEYLNGGYFLCDPIHPGVFLSINIG
jgi:hypothetical protein